MHDGPARGDAALPSLLDHERVRELAQQRFGLELSRRRRRAVAVGIARRLVARGFDSVGAYCRWLRDQPAGAEEWGLFADAVTNPETYFFRARSQLHELIAVLGDLGERPVRVLSAGCSSGEEAYSLAAVLAAHAGAGPRGFEVVGVDVSTPRIAAARAGRYRLRGAHDERSVPGGGVLDDHFERDGDVWTAGRALRSRVRFHVANLAEPGGLGLGRFDVVFCRNVLAHAHVREWPRFLATLAGALAPDGHLFLGDSESLLGHRAPFAVRRLRYRFAYVHAEVETA